jgi:hypothetical protein
MHKKERIVMVNDTDVVRLLFCRHGVMRFVAIFTHCTQCTVYCDSAVKQKDIPEESREPESNQ